MGWLLVGIAIQDLFHGVRRARERAKLMPEQAYGNLAHISLARGSHMVEPNDAAGMHTLIGVLQVL